MGYDKAHGFSATATSAMRPTGEVRFIIRYVQVKGYDEGVMQGERVLQQRWESLSTDDSATEWRDVPTVDGSTS